MKERADSLANRVSWLRDYALTAMQATGVAEVSTDEFAAKVARKPPSVLVAEGANQAPQYVRTTVKTEPDKQALKDALQRGEVIDGAVLVSGFRLSIR